MSLCHDPEGFQSVLVHLLGTGTRGDSSEMGQTPMCANPSMPFPARSMSGAPRIAEEKKSPATKAGHSLPCTQLGHPVTITSPPSPCWTPPLFSTQTPPQGRVICPWQGFPASFVQDRAPQESTSRWGWCHPWQLHEQRKLETPRSPRVSAHHEPRHNAANVTHERTRTGQVVPQGLALGKLPWEKPEGLGELKAGH